MDMDSKTPDAPEFPIYVDQQGRWKHIYNVLSKRGPFTDEDWNPGPEPISALESSKILVMFVNLAMFYYSIKMKD
ncbi:hypothetical protein ACN38_g10539 [Penicillium nordicum]|uniref:Uncharacterized protein n=1 Tax=Penicillium nordicum TaxID=229535 RepID=A0A0M8P1D6_9EURO|nr:hypothetical protein ACN38_g10539 [Penicillium nordicum]